METNETLKPNWKDRMILIIEDIDFSFLYLESILRATGVKIMWAQNGREAIEMIKSYSFDVVLMDTNMPGMNGFDCASEIKKNHPGILIIAMIASPEEDKKALSAGCVGCLQKPIRKRSLLDALAEQFEAIDKCVK